MTIKQQALRDVVLMALMSAVVGTLIAVAAYYLGTATVGTIAALVLLIYLGRLAYDMRVSQLEHEQQRVQRALREGR